MNHDDNRPEHDLHVLTVDDYNERGSYGTMLVCSCGERVSIDGDSWDYADTLVCMHLGYYDKPRLDFPDFIDKAFARVAADQAIVAAAKAWGAASDAWEAEKAERGFLGSNLAIRHALDRAESALRAACSGCHGASATGGVIRREDAQVVGENDANGLRLLGTSDVPSPPRPAPGA